MIMATPHLQNERPALRVDLTRSKHCAQSEAANRTIRADDASDHPGGFERRRRTNHWTDWRKRAKVTPRRT